jgi:hypothetical protein
MAKNEFKIIINFVGDKINGPFKGYKIFENIYNFNNNEIIFLNDSYKKKKYIEFQLILKNEKGEYPPSVFKFFIYIGINKVYCFIKDDMTNRLFDFCFLDKNVEFNYKSLELKDLNYLENDTRSRIVLINSPSIVKINDELVLVSSYLHSNLTKNTSFQISSLGYPFENYSIKVISDEEINDEIPIVDILKNNMNILKEFYKEFQLLIKQNEKEIDKYKKLLGTINIKKINFNFSRTKDILIKYFPDNDIYYLFYIYMLWFICDLLFIDKDDKKEKKNDKNNNQIKFTIFNIFNYFEKFYKTYLIDENLLPYQKVLLFCSNVAFFTSCKDITNYEKSELEYINLKNLSPNSVFGLSIKFLNDFIDNINSKSYLFYPLLLLDSGLYYNDKGETTYGFDFESCDNLKEHLKDVLPDVFFIYKEDEKLDPLNEKKGFNYKGYKTIFLNKSSVLKGYNGNPQKEEENIIKRKHYAVRVSKLFMHESFGHNKFIYQKMPGLDSPNHFYNKQNEFITMIPKTNKILKIFEKNIFYINRKFEGGEGGNFFEYFFGLDEDGELILDLIYNIKYIGKLIDNVQYFTSENLEILKEYIIYKYKISEKNIEYIDKENTCLEDDIKEMKNLIEKKNVYPEEKIRQKPKDTFNKKEEHKKSLFIKIDNNVSEIKGYSYYSRKMDEAKSDKEFREYAREFFFHHLKKE